MENLKEPVSTATEKSSEELKQKFDEIIKQIEDYARNKKFEVQSIDGVQGFIIGDGFDIGHHTIVLTSSAKLHKKVLLELHQITGGQVTYEIFREGSGGFIPVYPPSKKYEELMDYCDSLMYGG